ncbi:hypothetical protein PGT21_008855 [Puccinia graminis f. sp. tritici]|uniref:Uncharacterized protein n=1 Tax=Puccinia graminis f. sp. tritici TaxID=56615 RepID=A0A5B0QMR3_PUCGR|nr:hypothetical protein PGT21_008855 [Puccinia graminis f. sp. tritici]
MGIGRDELMISQRGADLPCCRSGLQLIPADSDIVNLEECHMDETGRFLQLGAGSHSSLTANDGFFNTNAPCAPTGMLAERRASTLVSVNPPGFVKLQIPTEPL